jgi:negative regulator of sigma E activity
MDGALPPDETRFLLRRLQHDASLAECWQRWRLGGEVMRGLAPAQRLPADFATRVSAAIFDSGQGTVLGEPVERRAPKPAWLRWGGGAAMAASLAVVVGFIARQPAVETPATPLQPQVAAAAAVADPAPAPAPALPEPAVPSLPIASDTLVAATATAIAAASRPQRSRDTTRSARGLAAAVRQDAAVRPRRWSSEVNGARHPSSWPSPWPRYGPAAVRRTIRWPSGFGDAHPRAKLSEDNPFAAPPALAGYAGAAMPPSPQAASQADPASQASPAEDAPRP